MIKPMKIDRPHMPAGYTLPKVDDTKMLTWEWVEAQMVKSRNYWICSTRPDGKPHASPVWGVWVEGGLYFGSGFETRRIRNLRANPEMVVHLESGDDVVIMEGTLLEVHDKPLLDRVGMAYGLKYPSVAGGEQPADSSMFSIQIRRVLAWQESDFVNTQTRWTFSG